MGTVSHLPTEPRFDRWHRVIIARGQEWVEKIDPTGVWIVDRLEDLQLDDQVVKLIHLKDFEGAECESVYTEKFFRKWFYEINQPRRKENMARPEKPPIQSLKRLLKTGLVAGGQKK